jgi:Bacterial pre-peptidase C-terminal domain
MTVRRNRDAIAWTVLLTSVGFSGTPPCSAKPPTLTDLFPPGAARGQTAAVSASGTFDHWPVKGWITGPGVEIRAEKEKGKLSVTVAADAPSGLRWLRLYDEEGATALRPFVIGSLPEIVEVEPNDGPASPHRLDAGSTTVNGRLSKAGDVDGFAVKLNRGQSLVASLDAARHFGSPMDAVLQVVSTDGFVLAQNDDDVGRDPRIIFEAPATGPYIVRLFAFPSTPDSSIRFAGGSAFVYQLILTTGGYLDYVFPLAVGRDGPQTVEAIGWNIPKDFQSLAIVESDASDLITVFHPTLAGTALVRRAPFVTAVETEPNDLARPQMIASPVAVSGRIDQPGDQDTFRISLKKGDKRLFRVESRALGRPLDPVLRVLDAGGKILAESDDTGRNSRDLELSFTAPVDGKYRLMVRDLNGNGGPRFAYLLSVVEPQPDFALSLAADRFDVTPGKSTRITVAVQRMESFAEPIEIVAEGLPAGVAAKPVTSKAGDASAKTATLELSADRSACSGAFRIGGSRTKAPGPSHKASTVITGFDAKTTWLWATACKAVTEKGK